MSLNRLRLRAIAAWLGVIALGCNSLVPIRFALVLGLDLTHARQCGHYEGAPLIHDAGWWMLKLLTGQDPTADPFQSHNGFHPAFSGACGVVGAPPEFIDAARALLPLPTCAEQVRRCISVVRHQPRAPPLAYQSRAPPVT
jgi:hypothetical protein